MPFSVNGFLELKGQQAGLGLVGEIVISAVGKDEVIYEVAVDVAVGAAIETEVGTVGIGKITGIDIAN